MATSLYFTSITSLNSTTRPGICVANSIPRNGFGFDLSNHNPKPPKFQSLQVKAADDKQSTKTKSIVCADCDGNGAVQCSQCKGTGVNSVDHFNGRFKAGELCWLCRGKKEVLCGNCNGAGFIGGFLSTFDD